MRRDLKIIVQRLAQLEVRSGRTQFRVTMVFYDAGPDEAGFPSIKVVRS